MALAVASACCRCRIQGNHVKNLNEQRRRQPEIRMIPGEASPLVAATDAEFARVVAQLREELRASSTEVLDSHLTKREGTSALTQRSSSAQKICDDRESDPWLPVK